MSDPIYLFLLVPNGSGSTWLQNVISLCGNCVSFSPGLDGKGVCALLGGTGAYPNQEINKLFSEKREMWGNPEEYSWELIKILWNKVWSENQHYETADPRVYLEKTPQAIYVSDMYIEHFDNVRFIIMIRNPYAVAEGMRRTIIADVPIQRCIRHWVKCAQRQIYNYETYKDIAIEITYEELVGNFKDVEQKIRQLVPAPHDIDLTKEAAAHSLEGMKVKPLTDFNERQTKNLSAKDIATINQELEQVPEVLEYFGYEMIKGT